MVWGSGIGFRVYDSRCGVGVHGERASPPPRGEQRVIGEVQEKVVQEVQEKSQAAAPLGCCWMCRFRVKTKQLKRACLRY